MTASAEHFLNLIRRQEQGRLKIYLGYAAGVGKTYQMLQEAHRLKQQGVDVVVGIVETHNRADTAALVQGLEQIPRRSVDYRGVVLQDMDVDALIARKPAIALVDELAHSNVPGSRNTKRYQDVIELLRAGIDVISTLNIQHLETLCNIVEKATGVVVKERVPDFVIGAASELVNVDVSAEDLRDRLTRGKIYRTEQIESALESFFTHANLTHLRELAMEEIAFRLDSVRQQQEPITGERIGSERVMVCLGSRSPNSVVLLRRAARLADRLKAPWYAVYVQVPKENLDLIDASTQRHIGNTLTAARELNGIVLTFKGPDVASVIAAFVKEYGITHVVMGRSQRPWFKRFFQSSLLERLLPRIPGVDVMVIDTTGSRY
jgi:two-component system sensor histidine kinase KdpD